MVPLDPAAAWHVRSWLGPPEGPGLLALHHALAYRVPGLFGDRPGTPRGVLLVREGTGGVEVFGAGEPEPAVGWLVGNRRPFTLLAPDPWHDAVVARLGEVEFDRVETWAGAGVASPKRTPPAGASAIVRRLAAKDSAAFLATAPPWALRGWRTYPSLVEDGAAFGVPHAKGFAAVAWVFDRAESYDAIAAFTAPRFRRLGLGRAAATALIAHVVRELGQAPLWSARPENAPSVGMAKALGFSVGAVETLLRWPPRGDKARGREEP